jgi:hypothetical protein
VEFLCNCIYPQAALTFLADSSMAGLWQSKGIPQTRQHPEQHQRIQFKKLSLTYLKIQIQFIKIKWHIFC